MKDFISSIFIYLVLGVSRLIPFGLRIKFIGWIFSNTIGIIPSARKRVYNNFDIALPDLDAAARLKLLKQVGKNSGKTMAEILFNKEFKSRAVQSKFLGPGLEILKSAKRSGKGAVIISAHFGQWEAIRHLLKDQGMETGAVFKPLNNPWLRKIWREGIVLGGTPLVAADASGTMEMIRHIKQGGFMAVLVDQKFLGGEMIDFLGTPALTTTSVAKMALKYDVPLVPVFATRNEKDSAIEIEFCKALEGTSTKEIMENANYLISEKIMEKPDQWFWLHRRWKT